MKLEKGGVKMKRYKGGERVPHGVYLKLKTWEYVQIHKGVPILPGGEEVKYIRTPAPLMVVTAPITGLAYIMFLPFTGVIGIAGYIAYKLGRGTQIIGDRIFRPAAIGWHPGRAYLTKRGHLPEEDKGTEEAEGKLADLEKKIADMRDEGKE